MILTASLTAALLSTQVLAGGILHDHSVLHRRSNIDEQLRRHALEFVAKLDKRQDPSPTSSAPAFTTTPQSGDASKADLNMWDANTSTACQNALAALNGQASNPSGMAVCYNLPFLDNTTGVFEAELRMYNVSAPIDPWLGVTVADISMTLSYLGATVQATSKLTKRQSDTGSTASGMTNGSLLKVLSYVGKINSNLMGTAMTAAQLQPLLIPSIVLSAKAPQTQQQVNTTLSSTEASFVNGVFAKVAATTATGAAAAASASQQVATVAPYVIPGQSLGIFPTGLIVTATWILLFMVTVGYGTVGRIQFREQYRRRKKRELAEGVKMMY